MRPWYDSDRCFIDGEGSQNNLNTGSVFHLPDHHHLSVSTVQSMTASFIRKHARTLLYVKKDT